MVYNIFYAFGYYSIGVYGPFTTTFPSPPCLHALQWLYMSPTIPWEVFLMLSSICNWCIPSQLVLIAYGRTLQFVGDYLLIFTSNFTPNTSYYLLVATNHLPLQRLLKWCASYSLFKKQCRLRCQGWKTYLYIFNCPTFHTY